MSQTAISIPPRVASIIREVADYHRLPVRTLLAKDRSHRVAHVRFEAYWRVRHELEVHGMPPSLPQIAAWFGGGDHTSVLHGIRRFEELNPSKVPPSRKGDQRIAFKPPTKPAPHRFQMLSDLAEAAA